MKKDKIYNKFLVLFMWGKAKKLKQVGCKIVYFNKQLEKHIMNWSKIKAKKIYSFIKKDYTAGLTKTTCPFCLFYYYLCSLDCFYGQILGNCCSFDDNSTWKQIVAFYTMSRISNSIKEDFSKEFYENLIEKIEKKLKIS